jgi:hypothetical protein
MPTILTMLTILTMPVLQVEAEGDGLSVVGEVPLDNRCY